MSATTSQSPSRRHERLLFFAPRPRSERPAEPMRAGRHRGAAPPQHAQPARHAAGEHEGDENKGHIRGLRIRFGEGRSELDRQAHIVSQGGARRPSRLVRAAARRCLVASVIRGARRQPRGRHSERRSGRSSPASLTSPASPPSPVIPPSHVIPANLTSLSSRGRRRPRRRRRSEGRA
jgi:hypothetical protein